MLKRPSEQRLTLEERVAVVVAIAVSLAAHAAIFFFGGGITRLMQEEQKRERLMVVRRVRETAPPPEMRVRLPDPRRVQVPEGPAPEGASGGAPPKPGPKPSGGGTPPPPKAEIAPRTEEDLQESQQPPPVSEPTEAQKTEEVGESAVSVVTDLPSASFTLSGPVEYRGSGTFWIRRGAPAGTYRIVFGPVEGFGIPPPQSKDLPEKGQIVFVGKYRRSTEIVVQSNQSAAQFTVYRPDGRPLDLQRQGRVLVEDLPPGTYTAIFKDIPGQITPRPISRTLAPGGVLSFQGEYRVASGGGGGAAGGVGGGGVGGTGGTGTGVGEGSGTGSGSRGTGSGAGGGGGRGRGGPSTARAPGPEEGTLDRRVQLVVKSYPLTEIEEAHDPIAYPEVVIRKSNFQQGWCQVYLVLTINADGEVESVMVERPRPEDRAQYEALIKAVEQSVRAWDYDRVAAEVHVDVRFYVE